MGKSEEEGVGTEEGEREEGGDGEMLAMEEMSRESMVGSTGSLAVIAST